MAIMQSRLRRGGVGRFIDSFRSGQNVELSEETEPMPPETQIGADVGGEGALAYATTTSSSEGTSLTLENLQRMVEQASGSPIQSATEMQSLQREVTTQINRGIQEVNRFDPQSYWNSVEPSEVEITHTPVPEPSEKSDRLFPKDKDWEKVYRSRKPIEEKVSHILIHSQNKIIEVKKILEDTETQERERRKGVRVFKESIRILQRDIRELKKRKKELESETEEQKKIRATRVIQDILALPKVKKIEVDEKKRILITTDDMEVMKDYWDKPRVAGQYQILVDFYETDIRIGIRVLNITKRLLDQYDHPCINGTKPCWGNIEKEIRESFKERDLLEIVITMLLYISSPNDDTGWIEYSKKPLTERHKQGWEQFLEFATPCPKNFSFRKYEKQKKHGKNLGPTGTPIGIGGLTTPDLQHYTTTLGSMASTAQLVPSQPSRLPPLVVPNDVARSPSFADTFKGLLRCIVEFRDPETAGQIFRTITYNLERSGIVFIKEIELINLDVLEISGWTRYDWGRERIALPIREIHSRETRILHFDPPSWFRDVGRPNRLYYDQDMQNVPVVVSGNIPVENFSTTGGSTTTMADYSTLTIGGAG